MNPTQPFQPEDLEELDELLETAHAVVPLREVHAGNRHADVIALRHDVDGVSIGAEAALETAVRFAEWEADRGYRASFYLLHGSPYWHDKLRLRAAAERIALLGHEVGIHANGLAEALRTGRDPASILLEALDELRGYGIHVDGVVGHGDGLCPQVGFANDEMFAECARPNEGEPDRELEWEGRTVRIRPLPLATFGLRYEAVRVGRGYTNSDSGGKWLFPFEDTCARFELEASAGPAVAAAEPRGQRQLHLLIHPDWWQEAFA